MRSLDGMFAFALWDAAAPAPACRPRPGRQEAALLLAARRRAELRLGAAGAAPGRGDPARPRPGGARLLPRLRLRPGPAQRLRRGPQAAAGDDAGLRGRRGRHRALLAARLRAQARGGRPARAARAAAGDAAPGGAAPPGRRRPARRLPLRRHRLLGGGGGDGPGAERAGEDLLDRLRRRAASTSSPTRGQVAERFGTDHHELLVRPDAIEIAPTIVRHYGEPFADSSAIPSFYLAEMTRRHVTVALNGDGGDESFAGYTRYAANALAARLERVPAPLRRLGGAARRAGAGERRGAERPQPAAPARRLARRSTALPATSATSRSSTPGSGSSCTATSTGRRWAELRSPPRRSPSPGARPPASDRLDVPARGRRPHLPARRPA